MVAPVDAPTSLSPSLRSSHRKQREKRSKGAKSFYGGEKLSEGLPPLGDLPYEATSTSAVPRTAALSASGGYAASVPVARKVTVPQRHSRIPFGNRVPDEPDALSCDLFMRGCDEDDVENIMDIYTGSSHFPEEPLADIRRKGPSKMTKSMKNAEAIAKRPLVLPGGGKTTTREDFSDDDGSADPLVPLNPGFTGFEDVKGFGSHAAEYDADLGLSGNRAPVDDDDEKEDDEDEEGNDGYLSEERRAKSRNDDDEEGVCPETVSERYARKKARGAANDGMAEDHGGISYPQKPFSKPSEMYHRWEERGTSDEHDPGDGHTLTTSYAIEIALYVVTGILLIFVMEQFVQIGIHLGSAAAYSSSSMPSFR